MSHYDDHYRAGGFGYERRRRHWVTWVRRHYVEAFDLRPRSGQRRTRLIDVACGNGFWTSVFAQLGFDACGVDLSPEGIAAARDRYPDLEFYVGDAELPLPVEGLADVVFCRAISHLHRPDLSLPGTQRLTANLMEKVRPSGTLLVSYYTRRDGGGTPHHHYHLVSDLVRLFEPVGDVWRVDVAENFAQIGVRHREYVERPALRSRAVQALPERLRNQVVRVVGRAPTG